MDRNAEIGQAAHDQDDRTDRPNPQDNLTPQNPDPTTPPGFPIPSNPSSQSSEALGHAEPNNTRLRHPFCSQFSPGNPDQATIVAGVRALLTEWGRSLTTEVLIQTIRDVFPPARLFHPNILITPEYYSKLRKVFERYD